MCMNEYIRTHIQSTGLAWWLSNLLSLITMSAVAPLFCALCAGKCLHHRENLPIPTPKPGGLSLNTDTVDSPLPSPHLTPSDPATWEHRWFILQVSNGILSDTPSSPDELSPPHSPLSPTGRDNGTRWIDIKRWVPNSRVMLGMCPQDNPEINV